MPRKEVMPRKKKEEPLTQCSVLIESLGMTKPCIVKVLVGESLFEFKDHLLVVISKPMNFVWNPTVKAFVIKDAISHCRESTHTIAPCKGLTDTELMDYKAEIGPICKVI